VVSKKGNIALELTRGASISKQHRPKGPPESAGFPQHSSCSVTPTQSLADKQSSRHDFLKSSYSSAAPWYLGTPVCMARHGILRSTGGGSGGSAVKQEVKPEGAAVVKAGVKPEKEEKAQAKEDGEIEEGEVKAEEPSSKRQRSGES